MGFFGFGNKKKVVTYSLVKGKKSVYIGTSNSPNLRNIQHSNSGKKYDYLKVTSPKVSKAEAERRETRNLKSYRSATGKNPRYNKTSTGKFVRRY